MEACGTTIPMCEIVDDYDRLLKLLVILLLLKQKYLWELIFGHNCEYNGSMKIYLAEISV